MNLRLLKRSTESAVHLKEKASILRYSSEGYLISCILNKFINCIMRCGKRSISERIVLLAFLKIRNYLIVNRTKYFLRRFRKDPIKVFKIAIYNIMPSIGLKTYRGPQNTTQTIGYLRNYRRIRLALRWLHDIIVVKNTVKKQKFSKKSKKKKAIVIPLVKIKKNKRPFADMLALELLKASLGTGKAILKKFELHKRTYAQRAYLKMKF